MITITREEGGKLTQTNDGSELGSLLGIKTSSFWLDLEAPTADEFALLTSVFQFHPLAIEDAMQPHQRPKLDEFEGYFFLVTDEVDIDLSKADADSDNDDDVQSRQISMFLGDNYLITIHIKPAEAIRSLRDRCDRNSHIIGRGADFVLYTLLDGLVDRHFSIVDALDESIDDLEDRVVERPADGILKTIFRIKRDLTRLRRLIGPLREVLQTLTSRNYPNIQDSTLPYLRDVSDHLFRIYEMLDGYRDLMSNMLDAYLSQVNNRLSMVMQKLTAVATVFMPLSFLTGYFGMNFTRQPWINQNVVDWTLIMAVIATIMYWSFHRQRLV